MADDSGSPRQLGYDDVVSVLRLAAQEPPGLTLIGGQALNFWAQRYLPVSPALHQLQQERPFLSGDLDFVGPLAERHPSDARERIDVAGELAVAGKIADAVHGHLETVGVYGRVTLATLTYRDDDGERRVIHFLGDMAGVRPEDVARTSIALEGHLRVMNPLSCMESRISNVLDLDAYRTPHGRHQARASIICAQEFVREIVDQGHLRHALDANEQIFRFAQRRAGGCAKEGFHPFAAVLVDDRLPEQFRAMRYPQMQLAMERGRGLER